MFRHRYLSILLFGLVSCTTTIELEQPEYTSRIVVDGSIESGAFANVFLTKSSPFLTAYDSLSIVQSFLNYGKVTLYCSNGDSEIMTLTRRNDFFPPFVYKTTRMKGIPGQTYDLKVEVLGKVVTARTTIPEMPDSQSIERVLVSDTSCYFNVNLLPDSLAKSHVFVQIRSLKADKNFHPAVVPVFKLEPSRIRNTIAVYRSKEINLDLLDISRYYYSKWPKNMFSVNDTVLIKVGKVDVVSYQILKSLFADQSLRANPFSLNSEGIQTNIKGGIGRWTGIAVGDVLKYP